MTEFPAIPFYSREPNRPRTSLGLTTYGYNLIGYVTEITSRKEVQIDILAQDDTAETVLEMPMIYLNIPHTEEALLQAADALRHIEDRLRGIAEELGDKAAETHDLMEVAS